MGQNSTAAFVCKRVEDVYGRMTSLIRRNLLGDINMWVDRLTRRWNFPFMVLPAGQYALGQFPISDLATATLAVTNLRWLDQNWLITTAREYGYAYAYPLFRTFTPTSSPSPSATTGGRWVLGEIKRLEAVRRFSRDGVPQEVLEVVDPDTFMMRTRYATTGKPAYVTHTLDAEGCSTILFSPKPDTNYLYQFDVRLATLPPLDRPHATHAMLQFHPHVLITVGLMEAAKYFGEGRELETHRRDLWGAGYGQMEDPDFKPGGMVGEMIATGKGRYDRSPTMKVYQSEREALGRSSTVRRFTRGYYVTNTP